MLLTCHCTIQNIAKEKRKNKKKVESFQIKEMSSADELLADLEEDDTNLNDEKEMNQESIKSKQKLLFQLKIMFIQWQK